MRQLRSSVAITFTSCLVQGAHRGRTIGFPTFNLHKANVSRRLRHGIYACRARFHRRTHDAVLHFGPRPVFGAGIACELHVIGHVITRAPKKIEVEIMKRLRSVRNFRSVAALQRQIARDIARAKQLLG